MKTCDACGAAVEPATAAETFEWLGRARDLARARALAGT
jgi:hypothetical protein